jgi:pimeloyl-ACP methyl ester carboxylesterase
MSESLPCGALACPTAPVGLGEALRRYAGEAVHGQFHTGRSRCRYLTWGEGPPIVFIHGLADTPRSFVLPMARLAAHFRCIAYALPDGEHDGARLGRLTHADLVDDLFALLDHLHLDRAYLVGSSFGSTVALAAMAQEPARLPRVVLQGGFACRPLASAELLLARMARYWPWKMRSLPLREALLIGDDSRPFRAGPREVYEFYLASTGEIPMTAVAHRALLLHRLDLRPLLPRIRQPILLLCGDADPVVNRDCEDVLLRGLPNAGRLEFRNCGHFPYYTHPDDLAEAVRCFLTPAACEGGFLVDAAQNAGV